MRNRWAIRFKIVPPILSVNLLQHSSEIVVIVDHLPVRVGHALYAVPTVILEIHIERIGLILKRRCKSSDILDV